MKVKSKGFTLIELMVTMTLIAIMLGFAMHSYSTLQARTRAELDRQYILQLPIVIEKFFTRNHQYPAEIADFIDNADNGIAMTPSNYYRLSYQQINDNEYLLTAVLNNRRGSEQIKCANLSIESNGVIKGLDKNNQDISSECWRQ